MLEELFKKGYLNYEKMILENTKALGVTIEKLINSSIEPTPKPISYLSDDELIIELSKRGYRIFKEVTK